MKFLIVVDMQNDFITGALGTPEAEKIVPRVVDLIEKSKSEYFCVFTMDTHLENYLETEEGKNLPIKHCIEDSDGWRLDERFPGNFKGLEYDIQRKYSFGYYWWETRLSQFASCDILGVKEIKLCGLCTDICVISNALILKAAFPNAHIVVDASCCAGSTPEKHKAALEVMKSCQIEVIE